MGIRVGKKALHSRKPTVCHQKKDQSAEGKAGKSFAKGKTTHKTQKPRHAQQDKASRAKSNDGSRRQRTGRPGFLTGNAIPREASIARDEPKNAN